MLIRLTPKAPDVGITDDITDDIETALRSPFGEEAHVIPACTCGTAPGDGDGDTPYVEAFGAHDLDCPAEDVPPQTPEALAIWNKWRT